MTGAQKKESSDQLLDLLVYAPVGLALEALDNFPRLVERGKSQVTLGRFVAKTAARKGSSTLEGLAERVTNEAGQVIVDIFGIDLTPDQTPPAPTAAPAPVALADANADFPIAEYDSQAAAQIVRLLPQLSNDELAVVEAHEADNRNRVTILRKIAQLRDAE
jgi:hypothetical protein